MTQIRFSMIAVAMGCAVLVSAAVADELPLDPGKQIIHYTSNSNDGYSSFRGMVFTANEDFEITGLGLYTKSEGGPLNATIEVYQIVVTQGNVLAGATLIGSGNGPLQGPLGYHNANLNAPAAVKAGSSYLVRFGYTQAADENWFYDFDPNAHGDPPVDLGLVTIIDGTMGGGTGNTVAPSIQLIYGGIGCAYTLKKSKAKGGCEACPAKGEAVTSGAECEVVKDCAKKLKGNIACPGGGNGVCKVKGKRSECR